MLRKKIWLAALVAGVMVGGTQPVAFAQDLSGLKAADRQRDELFRRRAADIERMPETTPEQRQAKLAAINQLMAEWEAAKRQSAGMIGEMERAAAGTREAEARANYYNSNGQPSFMSKLADTALNIGGQVIGSLLQKWLNGGLSNEERSTLDRLMSERDAATNSGAGNPDNAAGRPIYDSNGNIVGWDRDGDNKADFGADENGNPTEWNGGSYKDGYDYSDPSTLASAPTDPAAPGSSQPPASPGGHPRLGGSTGPGANGGPEEGEDGEEKDGEEKDGEDEEKEGEGEDEEGEGKDGKGKAGDKDKDGKKRPVTGAPDAELATTHGRIMVLPKPDPVLGGVNAAGNVRPGAPGARPGAAGAKKDDWESWGDEWPGDSADNGDYDEDWSEDWGDDWGKKPSTGAKTPQPGRTGQPGARPAPGTAPALPAAPGAVPAVGGDPKLLDDLIRVEAMIANWRKVEKEKQLREKDPYAFGNQGTNLQGNYGQTGQQDPFAAYRTLDGRLDLTKVDVWLVAEDSWLEGKEPRRYRLRVTEESVETFDPIHEGYMVVRGTILDLPVDPNVMLEIKGEVKEMEVAQVVVSSKEPPAADGTVDPTKPGATPTPGF